MNAGSMYEQALGTRFGDLAAAVQCFHRLQGRAVLQGEVETQAPANLTARCMALCLGAPQRAGRGAIRFELDASPDQECWTRHFPTRTMQSTLSRVDAQIDERLGLSRLRFDLAVDDGVLRMVLVRLWFLGLPCPRWLMPRVVAEEREDGGHLAFRVSAEVPGLGLVAAYRGHLRLGAESAR